MYVTIPKPITDAMITGTNAPDSSTTDYPGITTWAAGSYTVGAYVIYPPENAIYRCAVNTSTVPPTGAAEDPQKWVYVDKNNPYRLTDGIISSPTVSEDGFYIDITPSGVTGALAAFEVSGVNVVNITVDSVLSGGEIYNRDIQMQDNTEVTDEWLYFFAPITYRSSFVVYDLPPASDAIITVDFQSTSTASVGELVIGNRRTLGTAIDGSGFDNADLSRVNYNDFGEITGKTIRPNINLINYNVKVDSSRIGYLRNILETIGKTTECVWAGSADSFDDLLAYGFYESFSNIIYSETSDCTIKVRTIA